MEAHRQSYFNIDCDRQKLNSVTRNISNEWDRVELWPVAADDEITLTVRFDFMAYFIVYGLFNSSSFSSLFSVLAENRSWRRRRMRSRIFIDSFCSHDPSRRTRLPPDFPNGATNTVRAVSKNDLLAKMSRTTIGRNAKNPPLLLLLPLLLLTKVAAMFLSSTLPGYLSLSLSLSPSLSLSLSVFLPASAGQTVRRISE